MRVEKIGDYSWENIPILGFPKRAVIYAIVGEGVVYVGSTSQVIKNRISSHIADARRGSLIPIHAWMRDKKFVFKVKFLEECTEDTRVILEKKWISYYGKELLNITDGGRGLSGYRFAGTAHARSIGNSIKTGSYYKCNNCNATFWRKLSQAVKDNCKFCSRECYQAWQRGKPKKVRNT